MNSLIAGTRFVIALGFFSAAIACSGSPTTPNPGAIAAVADLWLTTPSAGGKGLLLKVGGPVASFVPAPGIQRYEAVGSGQSSFLLIAETTFSTGELRIGTITTPVGARVSDLSASIVEVGLADYQLPESLTGYSLRLAPR